MDNNINWNELRRKVELDMYDNGDLVDHSSEIDWDELRRKVRENDEDGLEQEMNEELDKCDKNCGICNSECIGLDDEKDEYDFKDEHGFLDPRVDSSNSIFSINQNNEPSSEDISAIAWNRSAPIVKGGDFLGLNNNNMFYPDVDEVDIKCKHFDNESTGIGEVYIYPINDKQRVCLCNTCNANLASKMFEQIALETFMSRP